MIEAQGGDPRVVDDPALLPSAPVVLPLLAPRSGYVGEIDALEVGLAALDLGAGRRRKDQPIDPAVGLVLAVSIGDAVAAGVELAFVHARTEEAAGEALLRLGSAITIVDHVTPAEPLVAALL
jgi:thymidine phosphorylase